jgi:hypothetical protein
LLPSVPFANPLLFDLGLLAAQLQAQAFLLSWFDAAVLMWVMCITHSLWINVGYYLCSPGFDLPAHGSGGGFHFAAATKLSSVTIVVMPLLVAVSRCYEKNQVRNTRKGITFSHGSFTTRNCIISVLAN